MPSDGSFSEAGQLSASIVPKHDTLQTVQKLASSFQKAEIIRQEHQQQIQSLRRQVLLLEQRLNACEVALENREGELTQLSRVAGDLQAEASGVEHVLRQIEKRLDVLGGEIHYNERDARVATNKSTDYTKVKELTFILDERLASTRSEILQTVRELLAAEHQSRSSQQKTNQEEERGDEVEESNRRLERLEEAFKALHTRVDECTAIQNISGSESRTTLPEQRIGEGWNSESSQFVIDQLRRDGVVPFRDKSGKVRMSSSVIRVRNTPAFWGASHVRELCELKVGGVLSCLLVRESSHPSGAQPETKRESVLWPSTTIDRSFHVAFRSTEKAVKALITLHQLPVASQTKLRQNGKAEEEVLLMVDPVVPCTAEALVKQLQNIYQKEERKDVKSDNILEEQQIVACAHGSSENTKDDPEREIPEEIVSTLKESKKLLKDATIRKEKSSKSGRVKKKKE